MDEFAALAGKWGTRGDFNYNTKRNIGHKALLYRKYFQNLNRVHIPLHRGFPSLTFPQSNKVNVLQREWKILEETELKVLTHACCFCMSPRQDKTKLVPTFCQVALWLSVRIASCNANLMEYYHGYMFVIGLMLYHNWCVKLITYDMENYQNNIYSMTLNVFIFNSCFVYRTVLFNNERIEICQW